MFKNKYFVGIEREGLKCTKDGYLANTKNSEIFKNTFIGTDFGMSQLELRTPVCESTAECYDKLENITDIVINELEKENKLLWPYSMPCILPDNNDFINTNENEEEKLYHLKLLQKYSSQMLYMSGVHVNFSINKHFYKEMKKLNKKLPHNIDDAYMKIMRAFVKKAWILIYLFGATPLQYGKDSYSCAYSIRNSSKQGFKNNKLIEINFQDKQKYIDSIEDNIKAGNILAARELYIPIRAKGMNKNELEHLRDKDINHIEIRICDLNPFDKCAISKEQLDFTIAFLFNCLIDEDNYSADYRFVAENGISDLQYDIVKKEIQKTLQANEEFGLEFESSIKNVFKQFKAKETYASRVEDLINSKGYISGLLELASQYNIDAGNNKYLIKCNNKNLTAATAAIIKDALCYGVDYKIINNRSYDCFVEFNKNGHKEYVIGGTRTNKDNFILPYITDDKYFAKDLMQKSGINVPKGIIINSNQDELEKEKIYSRFYNTPCVVKPRTTNGGTGITVFSNSVDKNTLKRAINHAFKFDHNIMIEEYIKGNEYRFIVINGKCINVAFRRSASVVGNGKNTIQELIEAKDKEPWHFLLRNRMKIDEPLKMFLAYQNLSLDYIPKEGERIYLRENSNCSTGGESINVTDQIPSKFKKIAEKAAKVFKAKVCGVDIIINDLTKDNYAIIEINDDPGYDINECPYEGKEVKIGLEILKMLKLVK